MKDLSDVVQRLDTLLKLEAFPKDPSLNGLQLESSHRVKKILFGVDACEALFRIAAQMQVDLVIVHHGLFWGNGVRRITGALAQRIALLMKNNISLYAAHLPLDAHEKLGNNAQLADVLHLIKREMFCQYAGVNIGVKGQLQRTTSVQLLAKKMGDYLGVEGVIYGKTKPCKKIGIISGGAGITGIEAAIHAELDCLITGAFEHECWHMVQESELSVIALGHYATERCGLRALLKVLADDGFDVEFIEIETQL